MNRAIDSMAEGQALFLVGLLLVPSWVGAAIASGEQVGNLASLAGHWRAEDRGVRHGSLRARAEGKVGEEERSFEWRSKPSD